MLFAVGLDEGRLGTNKLQSSCGTALALRHYAQWVDRLVGAAGGARLVLCGSPAGRRRWTKWIPDSSAGVADPPHHRRVHDAFPKIGRGGAASSSKSSAFGLLFGFGIGFYDGFFGPGTGSFWTIAWRGRSGSTSRAMAATKATNLSSSRLVVISSPRPARSTTASAR
jgi:uncharacterized membrane protein YfcA